MQNYKPIFEQLKNDLKQAKSDLRKVRESIADQQKKIQCLRVICDSLGQLCNESFWEDYESL
jgi:hypothetical protein